MNRGVFPSNCPIKISSTWYPSFTLPYQNLFHVVPFLQVALTNVFHVVSFLQVATPKHSTYFICSRSVPYTSHLALLLTLITPVLFGKEYKPRSSSLLNFLKPALSSSFLDPNIFLSKTTLEQWKPPTKLFAVYSFYGWRKLPVSCELWNGTYLRPVHTSLMVINRRFIRHWPPGTDWLLATQSKRNTWSSSAKRKPRINRY